MAEDVLTIRELRTFFYRQGRKVYAVDGVSFSVKTGEILCIVGESGSGKSVTALSLMGLIPKQAGGVDKGEVFLHGANILQLPEKERNAIRGSKMAMIFQEPMTSLNPVLKIGMQLTEGIRQHQRISKEDAERKARDMLRTVGLGDIDKLMTSYPHQLSGGMRQRVMIAMAMMEDPAVLIADEPTTALDVTIQAQILVLIQDMRKRFGMSVIFVTHDLGVVREIADRVVVYYAGQIVETALVDELFGRPAHPYTQALLEAIPSIEDDAGSLYSIPGAVPDLESFPSGCRFSNRCRFACERCRQDAPVFYELSEHHRAACHRLGGEVPRNG